MLTQTVIRTIQCKLNEASTHLYPWFDEDPALMAYQPVDRGWSVLQILEHITLTNHYLLLLIDKGTNKALRRAQVNKIEFDWSKYVLTNKALDDIGNHKSFAWIRPNHMEPSGKKSVYEIKKTFDKQILDCFNYLNCLKNGEGILCRTTMSVNNLGKLDVYQYIYFVALHAIRHIKQLEETRDEFLTKLNRYDQNKQHDYFIQAHRIR